MKRAPKALPHFAPELVAIDRLEVGPVRVEPRRATAAYTVHRGAESHTTEMTFRYEEDVFEGSRASHNLASMMVAQVALNYGLFCERIVFRGTFDEHDRRYLATFGENTAREIFVNKLSLPNAFLTRPLDLAPPADKRFLQSALEFVEEAPPSDEPGAATGWDTSSAKHAILSSGGKDSLVSFGLLQELGLEVHPVFVNESGRHWYTALNAYRHLRDTHAATSRVWTNSDRVFAWMLRHLPFIREDFSRVRSDGYPIRLWTVAVFACGALPVLRKRGIGRLLIGDEYDTTVTARHNGIPHYAGLYDQSRYFDDELTRYYRRKGWGLCQFSILRPLSEILIQKVLAQRYPQLLKHQVSCHATHLDGERARPCGACEKCRRIVGMLLALDTDPADLGYTPEQIARCLTELAAKGVHQEAAGSEQLAHMLSEKKLIAETGAAFRARANPETLSLRFHPGASPVDGIPNDLRKGLYAIFLKYATGGALRRDGRVWSKFDPLGKEGHRPYAFESPSSRRSAPGDPSMKSSGSSSGRNQAGGTDDTPSTGHKPTDYYLGEMTWPEAEACFKRVDVALLPIGAVEQHGPHLPLDVDAFDADYLSRRVAEACKPPRPIVLPLIAYGVSYHHQDFPGTLSVSPETQARMVYEIGMSAARCGVTKLVMVNGHGGNAPALHLAAQMINRDAHIFTCVDTGETSDHDVTELIKTPNDVHAGEIETSTTLAIRPHLVKMDKAPKMIPRFSSDYLDFTSKRGVGWYAYTKKISKSGVMGDASAATAEKGVAIWDLITMRLVELVEDLKRLSLDEIYQRRY